MEEGRAVFRVVMLEATGTEVGILEAGALGIAAEVGTVGTFWALVGAMGSPCGIPEVIK